MKRVGYGTGIGANGYKFYPDEDLLPFVSAKCDQQGANLIYEL